MVEEVGCVGYDYNIRWSDSGGDGGKAGNGGVVRVSKGAVVNAFNGNRITQDNFDYSAICFEYDKDGNLLDGNSEKSIEEAKVITIKNNESQKLIPTKIFIQDGILRSIYKTNTWWGIKEGYNANDFKILFGDKVAKDIETVKIAEVETEMKLICVRPESTCEKTGYINPTTNNSQGIGSRSSDILKFQMEVILMI